jgi:hypothetical protein
MTDSAVFKTDVVKDVGNPNRFRWNIYENQRVRDKSFYSFATRREAQNDADKFVRKLDSVWPGSKEYTPANSRSAAGRGQRTRRPTGYAQLSLERGLEGNRLARRGADGGGDAP